MTRERGVVLLLALVLSLLLGVLTTSALRAAAVETQMVSLFKEGQLAFEQAEATLDVGRQSILHAPPPPCELCPPPEHPHRLAGFWEAGPEGFFQVQNLGTTQRAVGVPAGRSVTVFRVTAVSQLSHPRQVVEAVYASDGSALVRMTWRQRFRGD
ncbi:hypothetical protein [Pseudomonas fulva]|uniref:hypothetical protein n=1 Tax=Pseudomonas fulva TaxID=47880 RepID=UPI00346242CD